MKLKEKFTFRKVFFPFFAKTIFLSLILLAACSSAAHAVVVNYRGQGTFARASYTQNGVTVEGSANVNIDNGNGLGIVGGSSDLYINTGETVIFTFGAQFARTFSLTKLGAGNGDGDGKFPEANVEAFDESGASLGVIRFDSVSDNTNFLPFFSATYISKITFAPVDGDAFNISTVTVTLEDAPSASTSIPNLANAALYVISRTSQIAVSGYSDMIFEASRRKKDGFETHELCRLALNRAKEAADSMGLGEIRSYATPLIDKIPLAQAMDAITSWFVSQLAKLGIDQSMWFSMKLHSSKEFTQSGYFKGHLIQYMLGKDLWTGKNSDSGIAVAFERLNTETTFNGGHLDGFGFTMAPYFNWEILPKTELKGLFGISKMNYDVSSSVSYGDFDSLRYFPALSLAHEHTFGNLSVSPFSQVEYFREQGNDITDNLGNGFNMEQINGGNAKVGARTAYSILFTKERQIEITGRYSRQFYFDWPETNALDYDSSFDRKESADNFEIAMRFVNFSGLNGRLATAYISDNDKFKSWNISLELSLAEW